MSTPAFTLWRRQLQWLFKWWMKISRAIGVVMSSIILTVLWIFVFGAYAIILKAVALFRRRKAAPASYWVEVKSSEAGGLTNQF